MVSTPPVALLTKLNNCGKIRKNVYAPYVLGHTTLCPMVCSLYLRVCTRITCMFVYVSTYTVYVRFSLYVLYKYSMCVSNFMYLCTFCIIFCLHYSISKGNYCLCENLPSRWFQMQFILRHISNIKIKI